MIYCVEDERNIRELLVYTLGTTGFQAKGLSDGKELFTALEDEIPELILLDIMLPGDDGYAILEKLKKEHRTRDIPIIMVTAKEAEYDKVRGLDGGADDYITKPFEPEEVLVRVMAAFRRCGSPGAGTESERYTYKDLILDQASRTVTVKQREISLTRYEYEILCILIQQPRKVFSRESLYEQVWKNGYYGEDNTVNVHVSNIRKKIAAIDPEAEYIRTVWGIGFKMA